MVLAAITAGVFTCREFNRKNRDLSKVNSAFTVEAKELIGEFEKDDVSANKKYLGKVVTVKGSLKKVDKDESGYYTVILGDTAGLSSVFCAMDTTHILDAANLNTISSVSVKGYFIGFEKDETGLLGSDVKLNRCVIDKQALKALITGMTGSLIFAAAVLFSTSVTHRISISPKLEDLFFRRQSLKILKHITGPLRVCWIPKPGMFNSQCPLKALNLRKLLCRNTSTRITWNLINFQEGNSKG
jgi:hypothetical protein